MLTVFHEGTDFGVSQACACLAQTPLHRPTLRLWWHWPAEADWGTPFPGPETVPSPPRLCPDIRAILTASNSKWLLGSLFLGGSCLLCCYRPASNLQPLPVAKDSGQLQWEAVCSASFQACGPGQLESIC